MTRVADSDHTPEVYFYNEVFEMPCTGSQPVIAVEIVLSSLHEAHDLSVYDAVERLVHAAEAVGLQAGAVARMLDRGMTFAELLEVIESRMENLQLSDSLAEARELPLERLGAMV